MNHEQYIETIIKDSENYFRAFDLADNVYHNEGDIEWIAPMPGEKGPSIVYKLQLSSGAEEKIYRLIPDLQVGRVPSLWVLTPLSRPEGLADILLTKGFKEITSKDQPEYGMALDMNILAKLSKPNKMVEIRNIKEISEFATWIDVVNIALHRCELLTAEHYGVWLEQEELAFYLGFIDGTPVSTAATISNGKSASLEFVSTLKEYRNRGAAFAVCFKALWDLQSKGAEIVTLRCESEVCNLYEKLGFKHYYEQRLFSFSRAGQEECSK